MTPAARGERAPIMMRLDLECGKTKSGLQASLSASELCARRVGSPSGETFGVFQLVLHSSAPRGGGGVPDQSCAVMPRAFLTHADAWVTPASVIVV